MTIRVLPMPSDEMTRVAAPLPDAGAGAFVTARGNLPLDQLEVRARITGLVMHTQLVQTFQNSYDEPLEATYIFPLPDRGAVTAMRMEADDRVVEAELAERAEARQRYDSAIASGQRASIAEQERDDVFTMRVGNILPGERVTVRLTLVGALPFEDGLATFRFPLVVAPRYLPGTPLPGAPVGDGVGPDTDAVPDGSRITPPVLLPGFPNPVRLSIEVDVDPAGLPLTEIRSSLHTVTVDAPDDSDGTTRVRVMPGERADRDFILRLAYGPEPETAKAAASTAKDAITPPASLALVADADRSDEGTFQLTVLPPRVAAPPRPRDVVIALDRSGSMAGWKMVTARRAAARIVDTLTSQDRFAVLTFDHEVQHPADLPPGLVAATDRHRYRAVEHLARVDARGGTEMLAPLQQAVSLLVDPDRDRVLVLVTDGQVGNERQILQALGDPLRGVRVHVVGIDRAVNAGFLGQLAAAGGGRCELVESEERLDEATERIHRRIAAPVATGLSLVADGFELVPDTVAPSRLPSIFVGVPLVVTGRWRGEPTGAVTVRGTTRAGEPWQVTAPATVVDTPALGAIWARAHLRDLEDRYLSATTSCGDDASALERRIVATSLRFGVLCRFTAFVAVDTRVVTDGGEPRRVTQPVDLPSGWDVSDVDGAAEVYAAAPPMQPVARAAALPPGIVPAAPAPAAPFGAAPAGAPAPFSPPAPATTGFAGDAGGRGSGWQTAWGGGSAYGRASMPKKGARASQGDSQSDELAHARRQLAAEADRLRAATDADLVQRWEMLSDLGSRLDTLLLHLAGLAAVPAPQLQALRDLAARLSACDGMPVPAKADVDALWSEAIRVLDTFGAGTSSADADPAPRARRREFWK